MMVTVRSSSETPRVRYFALLVSPGDRVSKAVGMFREVRERAGLRLERVDRVGRWVLDYDLLRYLTGNDDACEEITSEQAETLAARLGATL